MQEVFYEESVGMHNEKPAKRRYVMFRITTILCVLFAIFSFIQIAFMPVPSNENGEAAITSEVTISIIIWAVLGALMIVCAVFTSIKKHSFFLSFDYTFVSGELRISKVLHGRKRKLMYRLSDDKLVMIGRVGSESYNKLKASPDIKEDILTPNTEAEEGKEFFYIQAATNVGKRLLVFECRPQLISTIVRYVRRNILESEFNKQ